MKTLSAVGQMALVGLSCVADFYGLEHRAILCMLAAIFIQGATR